MGFVKFSSDSPITSRLLDKPVAVTSAQYQICALDYDHFVSNNSPS